MRQGEKDANEENVGRGNRLNVGLDPSYTTHAGPEPRTKGLRFFQVGCNLITPDWQPSLNIQKRPR